MQPHQQRVVDEANELKNKCEKLSAFIEQSPVFAGLDTTQKGLLKAQAGAMCSYLQILNLRISSF